MAVQPRTAAQGDARAFVTWHELGMDRGLLDDALDTPLFRGEGEAFEPMHKTVAEFLAGKALSVAVCGTRSRAALPLSRALSFITAEDRAAPTELRGLYAWFAAHLANDGANAEAVRLIRRDAVSVLNYGDAAVFNAAGRRAILENLGQSDPYFRGSDVGVTAVGGLAGEDLAADFAAILKDRDNEIAASAMGVNVALYKTLAFGVSAGITGVAGGLSAIAVQFVAPDSFTITLSIQLFLGMVVGGVGWLPGSIVGAAFIIFVPNIAEGISKGLSGAVFGVLLFAVIYLVPHGARQIAIVIKQFFDKFGKN
ncbi:hypothetical protein ACVWYH_005649 [Bradyrhizobium sp. GM24.11]